VVELPPVGHIADGVAQPALDDLVRIGGAIAQPLLEGSLRWRQNENRLTLGQRFMHLLRTLPVDLEYHVVSFGQLRLHWLTPGPVVVIEHARVLEKFATFYEILELRHGHEVILPPCDLSRTPVTCRMRGGHMKLGHPFEQSLHEGGLSRAGWRRDDEELTAAR